MSPLFSSARFLTPAGLMVGALVLAFGFAACDKHPAVEEPAEGYGHGSGHETSKATDTHWLDGGGPRFSDSQGVEIKNEAGAGEKAKE